MTRVLPNIKSLEKNSFLAEASNYIIFCRWNSGFFKWFYQFWSEAIKKIIIDFSRHWCPVIFINSINDFFSRLSFCLFASNKPNRDNGGDGAKMFVWFVVVCLMPFDRRQFPPNGWHCTMSLYEYLILNHKGKENLNNNNNVI